VAAASLARRLRDGELLYMGWVGLPEPLIAELVGRAGFDCVCLEAQHALMTASAVVRGISAVALAGTPSVVRIPIDAYALASQVLDSGAEAVIAPMINTVEDARKLVAATKYPPLGARSWGPVRTMTLRGIDPPTQLANANSETLALAMIETAEALDNLDDILAVDGIDGVFVGPSDLSVSLSGGASISPLDAALDDTIADIAARARAVGKITSAFAATPERAKTFRGMGYQLVAIGSDQIYLANGIKAMLTIAG